MVQRKLCLILTMIAFINLGGVAYAYVDPGTGGLTYQILILIIGAVVGYLAVVKRLIKKIFKPLLKDKKINKNNEQ